MDLPSVEEVPRVVDSLRIAFADRPCVAVACWAGLDSLPGCSCHGCRANPAASVVEIAGPYLAGAVDLRVHGSSVQEKGHHTAQMAGIRGRDRSEGRSRGSC